MTSERIEWIDVCKGLAMLAIFIGHVQPTDPVTIFVFRYHVPLFFFLSGVFFGKRSELSTKDYFIKCAYGTLVPYAFFCALNIVFVIVTTGGTLGLTKEFLKQAVMGIRNQIAFGPQLWFLPCLFSIQVIYYFLYKVIKHKIACISTAFVSALISAVVLKMPDAPDMLFNIDSALYYIFFYSLGDILYPKLKCFSLLGMSVLSKVIVSLISFFVLGSSYYIYVKSLGIYSMVGGFSSKVLGGNFSIYIAQIIIILIAIVLIFANIIISFALKESSLLSNLGKNTLTLWGCEWIATTFILAVLTFFGIEFKSDLVLYKIIVLILKVAVIKILFFQLFNKSLPWAIAKSR